MIFKEENLCNQSSNDYDYDEEHNICAEAEFSLGYQCICFISVLSVYHPDCGCFVNVKRWQGRC